MKFINETDKVIKKCSSKPKTTPSTPSTSTSGLHDSRSIQYQPKGTISFIQELKRKKRKTRRYKKAIPNISFFMLTNQDAQDKVFTISISSQTEQIISVSSKTLTKKQNSSIPSLHSSLLGVDEDFYEMGGFENNIENTSTSCLNDRGGFMNKKDSYNEENAEYYFTGRTRENRKVFSTLEQEKIKNNKWNLNDSFIYNNDHPFKQYTKEHDFFKKNLNHFTHFKNSSNTREKL
ncbi:hypothetical protein ABK040_003459 [Willaertia magna]